MVGKTLLHYRIIRQLGKGGMGEVYLAEDISLKREVAIKVLPESLRNDHERLARFRREAEAAGKLKHPNIATIYAFEEAVPLDHGADDGDRHDVGASPRGRPSPEIPPILFIVMEYVEGESLKDIIPADGMDVGGNVGQARGPAPTFFDIFIPLADALAHAHNHGRIGPVCRGGG